MLVHESTQQICFVVDGSQHVVDRRVDPATKLSEYLRDYACKTVRTKLCPRVGSTVIIYRASRLAVARVGAAPVPCSCTTHCVVRLSHCHWRPHAITAGTTQVLSRSTPAWPALRPLLELPSAPHTVSAAPTPRFMQCKVPMNT